ncbi:hypothetical protein [Nocardioides sp. WS12]|uniref:hypothetical protein n=1 Tax=Nocardioides sp. WS12 TaxID=2486272 RepID=UPI0015F8154D|nr:hypothetical protein [Nocardioides sp. WS12]
MPTPEELAVDLHDLWFAEQTLDLIASSHFNASLTVALTEASYALTRPASIGLGATGFNDAFEALKGQINDVLNTNHTNLKDSAAAMRLCIADFTATDDAVKQELNKRKQEIPYDE